MKAFIHCPAISEKTSFSSEAFGEFILLGLSWRTIMPINAGFLDLLQDCIACEFGARARRQEALL